MGSKDGTGSGYTDGEPSGRGVPIDRFIGTKKENQTIVAVRVTVILGTSPGGIKGGGGILQQGSSQDVVRFRRGWFIIREEGNEENGKKPQSNRGRRGDPCHYE